MFFDLLFNIKLKKVGVKSYVKIFREFSYDAFYFEGEQKFFVYFSRILLALNLFVFAWILEETNEEIRN